MKKITGLMVLLVAGMTAAHAQGFYFRAGLGYAVPMAGQSIDGDGTPYNGNLDAGTQQYSLKNASFTAGLGGTLGVGYMINEHVGIQLDANSAMAARQYKFMETNYSFQGVSSTLQVQRQCKSLFLLTPSLVLQTGEEKVNLYSRLGMVLPLGSKIQEDEIITTNPGAGAITSYDFTIDVKSSFSLGFSAAAGVKYKRSDRVSLWGELSIVSMSLYIKQDELVALSVNGQGQSLSSVGGPLVNHYTKSGVQDSSGNNRAAYTQPFSNIGFNAGISFSLSNGAHRSHSHNNNGDVDNSKPPYRRR